MAHQPLELVSGLRLYSDRREPRRPLLHVPKSLPYFPHLRDMAWRRLDFRHLGNPSRAWGDDHAGTGTIFLLSRARAKAGQAARRLHFCVLRLDLLPRGIAAGRFADYRAYLQSRLARPGNPDAHAGTRISGLALPILVRVAPPSSSEARCGAHWIGGIHGSLPLPLLVWRRNIHLFPVLR